MCISTVFIEFTSVIFIFIKADGEFFIELGSIGMNSFSLTHTGNLLKMLHDLW